MRSKAIQIIAALAIVTLIITFPTKADSNQPSSLREAMNEIIVNEGGAPTTKDAEPTKTATPEPAAPTTPAAPPVVQPAETKPAPKPTKTVAAPEKPLPDQIKPKPKVIVGPTKLGLISKETMAKLKAKAAGDFPRILLVVDRSASMIGYFKWVQHDVKNMINALPDGAEFNLVLLGQEHPADATLQKDFVASSMNTREQAAQWIDAVKAEDGTNGVSALEMAMNAAGEKPTQIILFSDGGFLRPDAILNLAKTIGQKDNLSLNTRLYGSATRNSASLMQNLARLGGGAFQFVTLIK